MATKKKVRQLIFSLTPGSPHTYSPPEQSHGCRSGSGIRYFLTPETGIWNG